MYIKRKQARRSLKENITYIEKMRSNCHQVKKYQAESCLAQNKLESRNSCILKEIWMEKRKPGCEAEIERHLNLK